MGRVTPLPYAARWYAAAVSTALNGPVEKRAEARALVAEYGAELRGDVKRLRGQDEDGLSVGLGGLVRELLDERLGGH